MGLGEDRGPLSGLPRWSHYKLNCSSHVCEVNGYVDIGNYLDHTRLAGKL